MKMKILTTVVIMVASVGQCLADSIAPSPETILQQGLEVAKQVHTAEYVCTTKRYNTLNDSYHIDIEVRRVKECEDARDTTGVGAFIEYSEDGNLAYAYQGDEAVYPGFADDYMEVNDLSKRKRMRTISPPFFHRIRNLCDYLLTTPTKKELTLEETDSTWTVDATVHGEKQVLFFGYPTEMKSWPNADSHFRVTFAKESMMPVLTSYLVGWPQQRKVEEISYVKVNPFDAEGFNIYDHLPNVEKLDRREANKRRVLARQENIKKVTGHPVLTDTLMLSSGEETTLNETDGKIRIIALISTQCGVTPTGCQILNNIQKKYPEDELMIFGVLYQRNAHPEAVKRFIESNGIEFPVAIDNGRFYKYYSPEGSSPVMYVVDEKGRLWHIQHGANVENPEETENDIITTIEKIKNYVEEEEQPGSSEGAG